MAKANKQVIIDEIVKHILEGKGYAESFALICPKFPITRRTFTNYWKEANIIADRDRQEMNRLAKEANIDLEIESRKTAIMTLNEIKETATHFIRLSKKSNSIDANTVRLMDMMSKLLGGYKDAGLEDNGTKIVFIDSIR